MHLRQLILATLIATTQHSSGQSKGTTVGPIPLCDLLTNPLEYDGRLISIRGVWEGSSEGSWIEAGAPCKKPFTSYGYTWPQIVWVQTADSPQRIHAVDFHTDQRAFQRIDDQVRKMAVDTKLSRLLVTFVGVFETRDYKPSDIGSDGQGGRRAYGFGHLNAAPAQLLVKTVGNLVIEPR